MDQKCEGCTSCVKNCPTKAIRVHNGKAMIKDDYCIDCGECIRSCEHHAKSVLTENIDVINNYKYSIALLPPSFYGQFSKRINPEQISYALKGVGFFQVWDAALGAEVLNKATRAYLNREDEVLISSSCPVIVRLVQLLYPELIKHLSPFKAPVEIVAQAARYKIKKEYSVDDSDIGVFFITPCPAKRTAIENPLGLKESNIDGAIGVDVIYHQVITRLDNLEDLRRISLDREIPYNGIRWARSSGESELLDREDTLSVDGIHNVIEILEELDRGNLANIKYLELVACQPGCVGGVLNVKNPFMAKFNIELLLEKNKEIEGRNHNLCDYNIELDYFFKKKKIKPLDEDLLCAMKKLTKLEEVSKELPGLDCAACGAPDCRTLAEDIVGGLADKSNCVFILRKQIGDLADEMSRLTHTLPPVMQRKNRE
ncbi:[Fe-Fe] hydrogenase large subunit C-terminal domain-containing protein [Halonatronum saccharophilum]|uniref:[Fe-Fe] hydrogenase large subunit C-terminal domain-containing protein n=1 Tax=Halonatronum saccharophilum TaxID=150060 RepID=UPI0004B53CE7|nr:[Fe-Fe] hydrogenase large subunit C-terminal domain-containing protein [Halonatronum saccharophilum]